MIVFHGHRFMVFKTRKTGGTSFEIALSKYATAQDIVTPIAPDDEKIRASLGYMGPRNHVLQGPPDATAVRKLYNHMGAAEIRPMLPAGVFDSYVKAAIVRNPFDYAVSWYFWERSRIASTSREDFRHWLRANFQGRDRLVGEWRLGRRPNPGVFSSNRLITHVDGKCVMDVMLRYEHLGDDVGHFARRVGLPQTLEAELRSIRAKGSYRPSSATAGQMFEGFDDGQQMIRTIFAEEIELYRYELGT